VSDIVVRKGRIYAYRVFEAANEIALDAAEKNLAASKRGKVRRRVRLGREASEQAIEALVLTGRPLEVDLGERSLELPRYGRAVEARVVARVFEYGAISIAFELPIEAGASLASLIPLCDEIYDAPLLTQAGREEIAALLATLGDAAEQPAVWGEVETYTVIAVSEHDGPPGAARELRQSETVAKLLLGETSPRALGEEQRRDVLGTALSYFEDDLVIIDWNSALVLEPTGSGAIPEILEFATSQLLEHRFYDSLLDLELARIYEEVARAKRPLLRSPYTALARNVLRKLVELWEFTERVDNALKIIGDFYFARVYQAAVKRFRIPVWQSSLQEKQSLVQRAYDLLKGDVDMQRSFFLEVVIVLLILVEVITAFVDRK
jgi:hypothetical protein